MSNENEYPLMVYRGSDTAQDHLIVNNAEEEAIAKQGGFTRHDAPKPKNDGLPKPPTNIDLTVPQLKEELKKRNVDFAGNASREVLQGLYDEALAKEKDAQ